MRYHRPGPLRRNYRHYAARQHPGAAPSALALIAIFIGLPIYYIITYPALLLILIPIILIWKGRS